MMLNNADLSDQNRRRLFKLLVAGAAGISTPHTAFAAADPQPAAVREVRRLNLANLHTRERLKIAYHADGLDLSDNLTRLNYFLRDHRQNEATLMDKRLYDQLWAMQKTFGEDTLFEIVSAYRSPKTNAMLRASSRNVARRSFHIRGRALDFRVVGVSTRQVRNAALKIKAGGVGYYPRAKFVHIDTGPVRTWGT